MSRGWVWLVLVAVAGPVSGGEPSGSGPPALPCVADGVAVFEVEGPGQVAWRVVRLDLERVSLDLVGQDPSRPARSFPELDADVVAATNAGIYESLDEPSGWFVSGGVEQQAFNAGSGSGNFYWAPNGVFAIDGDGAARIVAQPGALDGGVTLATQSGPLLLLDGAPHAGASRATRSRHVRNLVAVESETVVLFVLSLGEVTLAETVGFVEELGVSSALYLDGTVSDLCVGDCDRPSRSWAGVLVARPR